MRVNYEGKVYNFPDDATDQEIEAFFSPKSNPQYSPQDVNLGEMQADQIVSPEQSEKYGRGALETVGMVGGGAAGSFLGPGGIIGGEIAGYTGASELGDLLYGKDTGSVLRKAAEGTAFSVIPRAIPAAAKAALGTVPKSVADKLYRSAAKFSTGLRPEAERKALKAAYELGIPVSRSGQVKLVKALRGYRKEVNRIIDDAATMEGDVPVIGREIIVKNMNKLREKYLNKPFAKPYIEKLDDMISAFRAEKEEFIPIKRAQQIKMETWAELEPTFNRLRRIASPHGGKVEEDVLLKIGDSLKSQIENLAPEIKNINPKYGNALELQRAIDRAVGRITNKDLISIMDPLAVEAMRAGGPWGAGMRAAVARRLLEWPRFKSWLAIEIANAGAKPALKARVGGTAAYPAMKNLLYP